MGRGMNALRLTFTYKDGVIQLVSENEVQMVVGPGDSPAKTPEQGFWVEMRDSSNKALFRRVLHNPIPVDAEVFSGEPGKTPTRVPGAPPEAIFSVVVPNLPDRAALALYSSHHEAAPTPARPPQGISHLLAYRAVRPFAGRLEAAQEIARFELKKP